MHLSEVGGGLPLHAPLLFQVWGAKGLLNKFVLRVKACSFGCGFDLEQCRSDLLWATPFCAFPKLALH